MNNVRTVTGAAVATAVLGVVVGLFIWQSRSLNMVDISEFNLPATETEPELVVVGSGNVQLIEAVNSSDIAKVESLLDAGVSANALDSSGNTEIAKLLVENGADVKAVDKNGNAILGKAAYRGKLVCQCW